MSDPLDALDEAERAHARPLQHLDWQPPMLATLTDRAFSDPEWIYERKLDGVRAVVVRSEGRTRLYSRSQKSMATAYPELVEALDEQAPDRVVLDGEIVAFEGEQTSFSRLQSRIGLTDPRRARATGVPVYLYLFDAMAAGGYGRHPVAAGCPQTETLRSLHRRLRELAQQSSPFADPVRERGAHWVRPDLVAQIGFSEWTGDGKLRHPRFQGLREDKAARDVVRAGPAP